MQESIGLGTLLSNTLAGISWSGFTLACAVAFIAVLWMLVPFVVFAMRARVMSMERSITDLTELTMREVRRSNDLLAGMLVTQDRWAGSPDPQRAGGDVVIHPVGSVVAVDFEPEADAEADMHPGLLPSAGDTHRALLADAAATVRRPDSAAMRRPSAA